jgi:hypothetical protein
VSKTAHQLIVGMMAGDGSGTSLHDIASKVADEILAKHVEELTARINGYERVIECDTFSHAEDAYYAGLSDAVDILTGDMDESE